LHFALDVIFEVELSQTFSSLVQKLKNLTKKTKLVDCYWQTTILS